MYENLFNIQDVIGTISTDGTVKLKASKCMKCERNFFPQKEICPHCWNEDLTIAEIGPYGTLYSFTTVRVDTPLFKAPYTIGYVDLDDNVRLLAQIEAENESALKANKRVKCVSRKLKLNDGSEVNGYKFILTEEEKS